MLSIQHQLNELEHWMSKLKSNDFFITLNTDEFLNRRDSYDFDSLWMRDYHIILQYNYSVEETDIINELRKKAYRQIYQLTSHPELAAYIRDDVEMITKSILRKQQDLWIFWHVWSCYLNDLDPTMN